ncbi:MAG: rRNA pseudouridine synthase [Oscillatoriales cyanobacterium SM2_2_1]|nr:rRNA pseudouridine synthase [Oscillatoriales cyanobacterium SM2_2_1]
MAEPVPLRLQKILAHHGIASRRQAESLIRSGRVQVNGQIVRELGTRADPAEDHIQVDGRPLLPSPPSPRYLLLHKPRGYLCTCHDPQGRRTILELVSAVDTRLYPIGRLDYESSGALILTNDGILAQTLTHPRYHIPKTYHVWVSGIPSIATLHQWQQGICLDGRPTQPASVTVLSQRLDRTLLEVVLHEGRNRQIRRVAKILGHPVLSLHRLAIGTLQLGHLPSGQYRNLKKSELQWLQRSEQHNTL